MKKIIIMLMLVVSCVSFSKSIFKDVGYFKTKQGLPSVSRSFTVYTNSKSSKEMIEYARKKMYTDRGNTLVHFFNNENMTPQNSSITNYNVGMYLEGATDYYKYMIGTYQKGLQKQETWWRKNSISMADDTKTNKISKDGKLIK